MAALILEALLARQQEHDATVTRLKAEGVTGDVRAAAQDELRNVKAQILLVLQAQYDGAAGDFAAQDELAPRLRAYMNKDQQKVFDRRRKHDRAAAAKGVDGGGEEQTAENDFAKNNTKKCKKEGDAVNAEDTRGACSAHAAKCTEAAGSVGLAVHFSHAERAVLPLVSFLAATLTDSPTVFEAVLKEADAQPRLQTPTGDVVVVGDVAIAKYLGGQTLTPAAHLVDIERLVELSVTLGTSERSLAQALSGLNLHLETRTYLAGSALTLADVAVFVALEHHGTGAAASELSASAPHVVRWHTLIRRSHKAFASVLTAGLGKLASIAKRARLKAVRNAKRDNYQELAGAVMGEVVTRFPPEPSGFLHIGHVKAALLNQFYARKYQGKMILRFDDTNPEKEKMEFQDAILEDLVTLEVKPDRVTYTSDSFPIIENYARQLIRQGDAYMDDTPQQQMQDERLNRVNSGCRDQSPEEALKRFEDLLKGEEEEARKYCLRAKMNMQDGNACMRDPVLYRYNPLPHHRTGTKYKAYPTYDFACPIVDSEDGVTHALRTNEYRQRIPQNMWVVEKLKLRPYRIQEFGRLNFEYTLMSKRKLAELVASGEVDGWDDPRFPTVRGMIRRGVQLPVLREFILAQGFSDRLVTMKWDKYWSSNKKFLEPRARRFMAIAAATAVPLKLVNVPDGLVSLSVPVHPKDASLGTRPLFFSNDLLIEQGDAAAMAEGEEVTLMQWGNVIIDTVARDPVTGTVLAVGGRTCSKGDVKATKLKVCFVARDADTVAVDLHEFDFLVSKPKMDDADVLADCLTSNDHPTRQVTHMVGEPALRAVTHGQIVQIMRRGMTRCDRPLPVAAEAAGGTGKAALQLFVIPDGKAKAMSAMATGTESIARR